MVRISTDLVPVDSQGVERLGEPVPAANPKPIRLVDDLFYDQHERFRRVDSDVNALRADENLVGRAADRVITGDTCLTHPKVFMETYLPVTPPHLNDGGQALTDSTPGRLWDISLEVGEPRPISDATSEVLISLADRDMMQGIHGMRERANAARLAGSWSPYERFLNSNDDIILIFEILSAEEDGLSPDERDRYHRNGSAVLRAMVDTTEIHNGEMLLAVTEPIVGNNPHEHTYDIRWGFADAEATKLNFSAGGEMSDIFEQAADQEGNWFSTGKVDRARSVLDATAVKILKPDTDFNKKIPGEDGKTYKVKSDIVRDVENIYGYLTGHEGSTGEPAVAFLRAHFRLKELDAIEAQPALIDGKPNPNYRPNSKEALLAERQRVWYGLAHTFQYLQYIKNYQKIQADFADTTEPDFNGTAKDTHPRTMRDPRRLEFIAFGSLDDTIEAHVTAAIDRLEGDGAEEDGLRMLHEINEHLMAGVRKKKFGDNFVVKAIDPPKPRKPGNTLRLYLDTKPNSSAAIDTANYGFQTHLGLPYESVGGWYRDEAVTTLLDTKSDPKSKKNFPWGIVCSGVVGIVGSQIPEASGSARNERQPLLVPVSVKYGPHMLLEKFVDPIYRAGNLENQRIKMAEILLGGHDLASTLMAPNVPSYNLFMEVEAQPEGTPNPNGSTHSLPRRLEMQGEPLKNGDAVAGVRVTDSSKPGEASLRFVRGRFPGQDRNRVRQFGSKRVLSKKPAPEVRWDTPIRGDQVKTNNSGKTVTVKTRPLFTAKLYDGAVYAWRKQQAKAAPNQRRTIEDSVRPHFRTIKVRRKPLIGKERMLDA
jgi:hypothetical protein